MARTAMGEAILKGVPTDDDKDKAIELITAVLTDHNDPEAMATALLRAVCFVMAACKWRPVQVGSMARLFAKQYLEMEARTKARSIGKD